MAFSSFVGDNPDPSLLVGIGPDNRERYVKTDNDGNLIVAATGGPSTVSVDNFPANQDVTVTGQPIATTTTLATSAAAAPQATVTVSTTSVVLAVANPSRKGIIITNNIGGVLYVSLGSTAVDGSSADGVVGSHRLNNGGSLFLSTYTGPVSAIAGTAGNNYVAVTEW